MRRKLLFALLGVFAFYFCGQQIYGSPFFRFLFLVNHPALRNYPGSQQLALVRGCLGDTIIYCDYSAHWTQDAITEVMSYYQQFTFAPSTHRFDDRIFLNYVTNNMGEEDLLEYQGYCDAFSFVKGIDCFDVKLVDLLNFPDGEDLSAFMTSFPEEVEGIELASSGTLIIQSWMSPNP